MRHENASNNSNCRDESLVRYHWYNFAFRGELEYVDDEQVMASVPMGFRHHAVTMKDIKEANIAAKLKQGSVLVSCSYLGYMTQNEFLNGINMVDNEPYSEKQESKELDTRIYGSQKYIDNPKGFYLYKGKDGIWLVFFDEDSSLSPVQVKVDLSKLLNGEQEMIERVLYWELG